MCHNESDVQLAYPMSELSVLRGSCGLFASGVRDRGDTSMGISPMTLWWVMTRGGALQVVCCDHKCLNTSTRWFRPPQSNSMLNETIFSTPFSLPIHIVFNCHHLIYI